MSTAQRVGIVAAVIGGLAAIAGVIIGLVPVSELGSSCGSGFAPGGGFGDLVCVQQTNTMKLAAWLLIIVGVAAIIGGLYTTATRGQLTR